MEENAHIKEDVKSQTENISINEINNEFYSNLDLSKIKILNTKCSELINEEKVEESLKILKKIELLLESNIMDIKLNIDKKLLVVVLHNISSCYQKLKDINNSISYLEAVIYHFDSILEKKHQIQINENYFIQHLKESKETYPKLGDLILELRYSAKFHLQMSSILSEANRHVDSLKEARLASIICQDNIVKTYYLYLQIRDKQIKNINPNNNTNFEDMDLFNDKIKLNYKIII